MQTVSVPIDTMERLKGAIEATLFWLDNLEETMDSEGFLDCVPNNFGGRVELHRLLVTLNEMTTNG